MASCFKDEKSVSFPIHDDREMAHYFSYSIPLEKKEETQDIEVLNKRRHHSSLEKKGHSRRLTLSTNMDERVAVTADDGAIIRLLNLLSLRELKHFSPVSVCHAGKKQRREKAH